MKKVFVVLFALVVLSFAGVAVAGPVEVAGGLSITGTLGTDGVTFPDNTTQTTAVNGSLYQMRVSGYCYSNTAITAIYPSGAVFCSPVGSVMSVGTGTGLTGGPITGSGTISLTNTGVAAGSYTNTNVTVDSQGRVTAASNGSPGGSITGVTAGTGLTGGGTSGNVTVNVDTTAIQSRVSGTCPGGNAIQSVNANGTVNCQAAGSGTVTNVGTGGGLTGGPITATGTISIAPGGVTDSMLATGISGSKISGNISVNNLTLPATSTTAGQITLGGGVFLHGYGHGNTFVGDSAGNLSMAGQYNTASGTPSLTSNTTGSYNTASGGFSLVFNTAGHDNTASGWQSLLSNTTASQNTAVGSNALVLQGAYNNGGTAWNSDNTAVGFSALYSNQPTWTSNGIQNTAVGSQSLYKNTTGYNNVGLGYEAGYSNVSGSGNIFLGYNAGYNETGSNKLHIANTSSYTLIYGDFDIANRRVCINCTDPATTLDIGGQVRVRNYAVGTSTSVCQLANGTLAWCSSSILYKEDVADLGMGLETVEKLRPVTFKWKGRDENDLGFIAEEVEDISPLLVTYSSEGRIEGVKYAQMTAVLVNAVKELKAENEALKTRLSEIESLLKTASR